MSVVIDETEGIRAADRFPCPNCAADMTFDPEKQSLTCPYCGHQVSIDSQASDAKEYDLAEGERLCSTDWGKTVNVVQCASCGAQTILEPNNTAQSCSFCGSSQVVKQEEIAGIKPESVIPFQIPAKAAEQAFVKWIGSRFFAPGNLKSTYAAKQLRGVYIPFWTYDSDTYSLYKADKGTHYWVTENVTVTRNGKTETERRQVQHTRWHPVSGTYAKFYDDELIHASERLDGIMNDSVGKYDLAKLIEYRPEYLSGFVAEKYSINLKQGWERAKESVKQKIAQGITEQINGDEVRGLNFTTSFDKITFKHTLLPLWMSTYTYQGKLYRFLVNGQSGVVHGEAPVSALKVAACVVLGLAAIAAIYFLFGNR